MTAIVKLDWSRILGFDQAIRDGDKSASENLNAARPAGLGTNVGTKPGRKPLGIADVRVAQLGTKIGGKNGGKPNGGPR